MIRRFVIALAAALAVQSTVFALYYDDLLFLHRPLSEIAGGPREAFERHAVSAMRRRRLTVHHLDALAAGAQAFGLRELEVAALERRATVVPGDRTGRLRLADALRRAGRLAEAEALYLAILSAARHGEA